MERLTNYIKIAVIIFLSVAITCSGLSLPVQTAVDLEDGAYWHRLGSSKLKQALKNLHKIDPNDLKAKNIIIFIGDGMGITTISAGRIFKGQHNGSPKGEESLLVFEEFPHIGLAKTYNVDKQVPDSAGTATAIFCGVKTLFGVIGLDATCSKKDGKRGRAPSIMDWAQSVGKRTGIVTTTRITHATPAATYAGIYDRDWECDTEIPADIRDLHVDIARQLVEENPGKQFNVILGGGLRPMGNENFFETTRVSFTGGTEKICAREDGRNLTDEWLKLDSKGKRQFVQTREQLINIDTDRVDHLLGLFRNNHLTYSIAAEENEPSLKDMVEQAIKILQRSESLGYVLMVEGGRIDQAHHQNYARAAMYEMLEFDKAISAAVNTTNTSDTLIIVTADHSHAMTFNGYPERGNDILGFANKTLDIIPYETLTYANGPGYDYHRRNNTDSGLININMTWIPVHQLGDIRLEPSYPHLATFHLKDETHGGEDVAVFATGPGSSLIHGVFEQNYLAYVMSYAGCMGPAKYVDESCNSFKGNTNKSVRQIAHLWHIISILAIILLSSWYI